MCRTQSGAANFSSVPGTTQRFLRFETQFAVAVVLKQLVNQPPIPDLVGSLRISGTEEPKLARIRFTASDPEDDPFRWSIEAPLPRKGRATIDAESGLFAYRPFVGAVGPDHVHVKVTDRPVHPDIPIRSASRNVSVDLSTLVNAPLLLVVLDGEVQNFSVGLFEDSISLVAMRVYENHPDCNESTAIDIYSLDLDEDDGVSFLISNGSFVKLGNITRVDSPLNISSKNIPNDLSL